MTDTMSRPGRSGGRDGRGSSPRGSTALLVVLAVLLLISLAVGVALTTSRDEVRPRSEDPISKDGPPDAAEPQDVDSDHDANAAGADLGGVAPDGYLFSDDTFWRETLRDAPVHEDSDALVAHLAASVDKHYGGVASFNVEQYNASYYVVDGGTATVDVEFEDCQDKGGRPSGLYDGDAHFADVPVPENARPAEGNDGALVLYSPDTNQLWEFWRASKTDDGWQACWGGRIDDVSANSGYFDGNFGTTATGLSHAGGMISLADMRQGSIAHTVALLAAEPATYKTFSWPAQRSDGFSDDPDAVPEGLRLRLADDVVVEELDLHPVAEMVALAAQEYGFVVVDKAGATGVYTESGAAEEARTGEDPWDEYLGDTPSYEVMRDFPWDELEAMPLDYGKP